MRSRVQAQRSAQLGPAALAVAERETLHVRPRRHDEHPVALDAELADEFFLRDRRDGKKPAAARICDKLFLDPSSGPVEEAHPLFPDVAHPEPVGNAVHGEQVGLENAIVGVDEIEVFPRDGPVGEPGKARCGERTGEADDGDTVKGDARGLLAPAVGEHVDLITGVGGNPRRQFAGEILGSAHEAELGDHDGDLFSHAFHSPLALSPIYHKPGIISSF